MIFKGNIKMTPAITEILDDNTPSNNKTYSSNKIETLIGGGGGGNIILYKKYNNAKWLNKLATISNLNYYPCAGSAAGVDFIELKLQDFDVINNISDLNNYDLYCKINNSSTVNNNAPFFNLQTYIETTNTTTKIIRSQFITLNNRKIAELYATQNIPAVYGSSSIDLTDQLIPIKNPTSNDYIRFKIHDSVFGAYIQRVLNNNVNNNFYTNFDTPFFKNIEILVYAIKK